MTAQVEKTLGPKKYHDRLPWFAEVIDDNTVRIDGSPPAVNRIRVALMRLGLSSQRRAAKLRSLGIKPQPGIEMRDDFGVTVSNRAGADVS